MTTSRSLIPLAVAGALLALAPAAAAQAFGGTLNVNVPVSGLFSPGLPMDGTGKPFVDYHLYVSSPGSYQIDLFSTNTSVYDPYLILMQNGVQIERNDDGAGGLNSRIVRYLQPGMYIVRVTRFGSGPVQVAVPFTISVVAAVSTTPPPPPPPPPVHVGPPLTESLANTMALAFYSTRSEWAGQYAITIMRTRVVQVNPRQAEVHIRYRYSCIRARCRGARHGVDQRVFYFRRGRGGQWRVVRMGAHMSAHF